ncbi:uncharacterized protein LOC135369269 isoform X1 [Ornithodoros turicata]|uniref:uncharacterized protein LOC135369269 isoform X1 n=1 Tax=Ornithodoros turicata TaxID=34597 RepID=UPI00313A3A2F
MADDGYVVVQGTGAALIEDDHKEEEVTRSYSALAFTIFVILLITIVTAICVVALNRKHPTPNDKTDVGPPGHVSMPKFPQKPPQDNFEDYTDSGIDQAEDTAPKDTRVCNTHDCNYVRQFIEAVVDTDRDPCDNFFKFACGKNERLPTGMYVDKFGGSLVERDMMASVAKNLKEAHVPPVGQTAFQKSAALFKHCTEGDKNKSLEVVRDFFREHQMDITKKMSFQPLDIMVKFIFKINIHLLFSLEPVELGARAFAFHKEKIAPPGVKSTRVREILSLIYSASIDSNLVRIVEALENKLGGNKSQSSGHGMSNDTVKMMELRKVGQGDDELSDEWNEALRRYAPDAVQTKMVQMTEADFRFFHRLFGKQRDFSKDDMRVFFAWRCASDFYKRLFVRTYNCALTTVRTLPNAASIGAPFRANYDERIEAITKMSEGIIGEIKESFRTCPWLDDKTRKGALKKISMLRIRLGLAPGLNTSKKVDKFYQDLPDLSGPFIQDVLSVDAFQTQKYWNAVTQDYSHYIYETLTASTPYAANAFHLPAANFVQINIPYLLSHYFNLGGPPEVNYGVLGYTMTHETMHGFDTSGRQYDWKGDKVPWFTEKSMEEFKIVERCYVEHINGAPKSRGYAQYPWEYQADVLGTRALLRAYQKAAERSMVKLGNVKGLTSDQLFYVASCLDWCGDFNTDEDDDENETHPPSDERCNLPLMNSVHFSKTFSCPDNSPMNPRQKCLFW